MSRRFPWVPLAALGAGLLVVAASLLSATVSEPDSAFSGRDGAAALVEEALAQDLETLRLLSGPRAFSASPDHDPERTLLVLVAPERPYRAEEVDAVHAFLEQGGSVLVADNFGHGNSITAPLGITFERVRLVEGSDGVVPALLDGRALDLRTANPTALHMDPGTAHGVLAQSSTNSFLDRDGDGLVSASEPPGPFPLMVEAEVGAGRLVALADPTVLVAADGGATDNAAFRAAILDHLLPEGGSVVVDESRGPSRDPWLAAAAALVGTTTSDPWRYAVAGLAVLLLLLGALLALDAWGPHRFDVNRFVRRADLEGPDSTPSQDPNTKPASGSAAAGTLVRWTRRGRAALGGGLLLAVLGLTLGNQQATYAASFLLLGGALAAWAAPVRVRAVRHVGTDRLHEETKTEVELSLAPVGRQAARVEVLDALAPEIELVEGDNWFQTALRPRKPASLRYQIRGALRGPYTVGPLRVRASDAFGLRMVEQTVQAPQEVLVLPRNDPLSRIPFKSRVAMLTLGPHLVNRAGDGTEFHALRDYQRGDSVRMVNWKASARSDGLVVNQRVHESMATITVFLDARAVTAAGTVRSNPLNEGCRAVMSIVTGALQARDKVRVFVYGDGVRELCPDAGRSKGHEISEALAGLEARGSTTFLEAVRETLPEVKPSSPFVLVTGTEGDDTLVEGLRQLRQRNAQPFVLALEIGTESESGEAEPEAQRLRRARAETIRGIQSTGTPVLPAVPGMPLGTLLQVGLR